MNSSDDPVDRTGAQSPDDPRPAQGSPYANYVNIMLDTVLRRLDSIDRRLGKLEIMIFPFHDKDEFPDPGEK